MAAFEVEKDDLINMRKGIDETKIRMYDQMTYLASCDTAGLEMSGYRNGLGNALTDVLKRYQKDIDMIIRKHLKKYPD